MIITLTPENAARLAKHSELIGWTPEELANHLLSDPLGWFADPDDGSLGEFLGAIYYPERASAQRALDLVTQMTRAICGGRLPDSFRGEIFKYPDGTFDFRTECVERPELSNQCAKT
jgi:hypothetical protein